MTELGLSKGLVLHIIKVFVLLCVYPSERILKPTTPHHRRGTKVPRSQYFPSPPKYGTDIQVVTDQICIPNSDYTFERNSIIISPSSGTILFKSRELIELYTADHETRIALKDIGRGKLFDELERNGKSYTRWQKEMKVVTEIYDF